MQLWWQHCSSCIVQKGVSDPPLFFHPPTFLISSLSLETCNPSPSWHPSWENSRFYDDTPESGRLKTIIKPCKPITYRNCVLSTECVLIDITVTISLINFWLMTHFNNKLKPHVQNETRNNICMYITCSRN